MFIVKITIYGRSLCDRALDERNFPGMQMGANLRASVRVRETASGWQISAI